MQKLWLIDNDTPGSSKIPGGVAVRQGLLPGCTQRCQLALLLNDFFPELQGFLASTTEDIVGTSTTFFISIKPLALRSSEISAKV